MGDTIQSGAGHPYEAKVGEDLRLWTRSLSVDEIIVRAEEGDAFTAGVAVGLTLTNDEPSAALFIKNNDDKGIIFRRIFIVPGISTAGVGDAVISIIINPETISTGTTDNGATTNSNFGSSKSLDLLAVDGVHAATFGSSTSAWIHYAVSEYYTDDEPFFLPKGSSMGVLVTPPPGNTSMSFNVGFSLYAK